MADEEQVNYDNMFKPENVVKSNWIKWDKVGRIVAGVLTKIYDKEGTDGFEDQVIYVLDKARLGLKRTDGTISWETKIEDAGVINVGIKASNTYIVNGVTERHIGAKVAFEFEKEIPSTQKGKQNAKSIKPYIA